MFNLYVRGVLEFDLHLCEMYATVSFIPPPSAAANLCSALWLWVLIEMCVGGRCRRLQRIMAGASSELLVLMLLLTGSRARPRTDLHLL